MNWKRSATKLILQLINSLSRWCSGIVLACDSMQVVLESWGRIPRARSVIYKVSDYRVNDRGLFTLSVVFLVVEYLEDS